MGNEILPLPTSFNLVIPFKGNLRGPIISKGVIQYYGHQRVYEVIKSINFLKIDFEFYGNLQMYCYERTSTESVWIIKINNKVQEVHVVLLGSEI